MKKAIGIVLTIIMVAMLTLPAFASDSPYMALKAKGLPVDYLDSLSTEMLNMLYEQIGENDVALVSRQVTVLNETNEGITTYGAISSSSMTLECIVLEIFKQGTKTVGGVIVGIDWAWQNGKPVFRLTDALSVNWDASLFALQEGSFLSQDKWRLTGTDSWVVSKEYFRPTEANQGGVGYHTQLTKDSNFRTDMGGSTILVLLPTTTIYDGSSKVTSINVNYIHNKNTIFSSFSFSKVGVGISINARWPSDGASDTANYYYSK